MLMKVSSDTTSLSVGGVEYQIKAGLVELPDSLPGATIKHLIEGHGMRIVREDGTIEDEGDEERYVTVDRRLLREMRDNETKLLAQLEQVEKERDEARGMADSLATEKATLEVEIAALKAASPKDSKLEAAEDKKKAAKDKE